MALVTNVLLVGMVSNARAIDIVFDYRYDTAGFFTSNADAKLDLEAAAQTYEMKLGDTLSAIVPGGSNTWTASFSNASTGSTTSLSNLSIAQNQLLVFVGGADFSSTNQLGEGGPGAWSASGTGDWVNTVKGRGQSGALASTRTDFGPWGGDLFFSTTADWYFDTDPSNKESFGTKSDFYSVAMHELGHLLGIGTAGSWTAKIADGAFTGSASEALYGGAVPVDSTGGHWASGTMSKIYGTDTSQEVVMDPALTAGTRKVLTALDVAGLQDVGWTIVAPEPSPSALISSVFALRSLRRRRQR